MTKRHFDKCLAACIALFLVAPCAWMLFIDRIPPLILFDGSLTPDKVYPGQRNVTVLWHARFSGRDCPGYTQRELIDSQANLWPKRKRARGGIFHPGLMTPEQGTVTTPPLTIPNQMAYGPAQYRVTQFYYCNFLQRWLRRPIIQPSVPIKFIVIPPPS